MSPNPVDWYRCKRIDDAVTLIWERSIKPFYRCNIWHIRGREQDLLIDSGMGIVSLREHVPLLTGRPLLAVASHTHVDHIGCHHEFEQCAVHRAEATTLLEPDRHNTIADVYLTDEMFEVGVPAGFSSASYTVRGTKPAMLLEEGDVIDLGDRVFEVLHLPGHSPGSIALWEKASGTLFSGDVLYDGPLIDDFYHSVVDAYVDSMQRLRSLPVRVVHAGHFGSFGRGRMLELVDDYVRGRRAPGCPKDIC